MAVVSLVVKVLQVGIYIIERQAVLLFVLLVNSLWTVVAFVELRLENVVQQCSSLLVANLVTSFV